MSGLFGMSGRSVLYASNSIYLSKWDASADSPMSASLSAGRTVYVPADLTGYCEIFAPGYYGTDRNGTHRRRPGDLSQNPAAIFLWRNVA